MSDLIRREDAIKAVESSIKDGWGRISPIDACQNIRCLPSADRPQGEWIDKPMNGVRYVCSKCTGRFNYQWRYCPNCGVRMKGEDDGSRW